MIGRRLVVSQAGGDTVFDVETVRDLCVLFELGGPFWFTLQSFHQSTLWDLLVPEEEGSRDSCLEGVEFELLVEIVNPVPAEALES
jgi:hypothetical protein